MYSVIPENFFYAAGGAGTARVMGLYIQAVFHYG